MFRTVAICLCLAVVILPNLAVAQDATNTGRSDWNTTTLSDTLLIGIIAGSVAILIIIIILISVCCCCFCCPAMCGGGKQEYYDEQQPYVDQPAPLALPAPHSAPLALQAPQPAPVYYPSALPEPESVVIPRPPPPSEPTYILRDPERRERVAYVVRDHHERGRYDDRGRRVIISSRGSRYDRGYDRGYDRDYDTNRMYVSSSDRGYDDDRRARYVSGASSVDNYGYRPSRSYYDSSRRVEKSDYY